MVNYVFVAAGQCGNQLSFDLLTSLHRHTLSGRSSSKRKSLLTRTAEDEGEDDSACALEESLFRSAPSSSSGSSSAPIARTVCLDTEPKVIENCLSLSRSPHSPWRYDPKSVLYRHGGAGNNWALGYAMASGEFLEQSLDCVRRELEHCDGASGLVFLHSLAGGTGSGLGTHITEACEDAFPSCFRANIVIAPHHFGEVVVQHYNALLCLSKIHDSSDGIILFENEIAQMLCKEMHGVEKPLLKDLNQVIASNLVSLFLPKRRVSSSGAAPTRSHHHLFDDLSFLCSHPGYRFAQVRRTPQTSRKSVEFTYDSWSALLKVVQRMQLSGTLLERHVRPDVNGMLRRREQAIDAGRPSPGINVDDLAALNKSLASIVTFHGEQSHEVCGKMHDLRAGENSSLYHSPSKISPIKDNQSVAFSTARSRATAATAAADQALQLYEEYTESHSDMSALLQQPSVSFDCSSFLVDGYKRSVSVLSNDQTITPVLQRSLLKCHDMFEVGAYVHQYTTNGLETSDFLSAFRSIGSIVHNYNNL